VFIHLPKMAALDTPAGGSELEAALDAYDIRAGDVVVLDSTQRVLAGRENDSDTIWAYYLCTGIRLKRRGITVIRTDKPEKTSIAVHVEPVASAMTWMSSCS
jgi:hypothetical protein